MAQNGGTQTKGNSTRASAKALSYLRTLSTSIISSRADIAKKLGERFGKDRNYYEVLGYKETLNFWDYYNTYTREHIAGRIVDAPPRATWKEFPEIRFLNSDGTERSRPTNNFDEALNEIERRVSLREKIERADRMAGIGHYGVLLLGLDDGRPLSEPPALGTRRGPAGLLYLTPFHEENASIVEVDKDPSSPRFGLPQFYSIKIDARAHGEAGQGFRVHHERVVHIAEGMLDNQVLGEPRLRAVFNLFDDMRKVVGGSAEFFWRIADRGIQFDLAPEADLTEDEEDDFEEEIGSYVHGLKRYIKTRGVTANVLGSETSDPRGPFNPIISLISGKVGIPQRILMGSERGQLASSQDRDSWNGLISERQSTFAEPHILRPLFSKLSRLGILPLPGRYVVEWPVQRALTEHEKAEAAQKISLAMQNYSRHVTEMQSNGLEPVMSPEDFRELYLDFNKRPKSLGAS